MSIEPDMSGQTMSSSYLRHYMEEQRLIFKCYLFLEVQHRNLYKSVRKMEEKLFNELFEMTEEQLQEERTSAYDRWNWDTGSDTDKHRFEAIEVMLEARKRTGLRK